MRRAQALIIACASALALPMCSCYAYEEPGAVGVGTYTPDYYEGSPVYYDNDEPYYYVGADVHFVPRDRPEYRHYRERYVRERAGYHHWSARNPPRYTPHHEHGREHR